MGETTSLSSYSGFPHPNNSAQSYEYRFEPTNRGESHLAVAMRRSPFPLWSLLVPIAVSVILWLVTGSVFALAIAAIGPIGLVASRLDANRVERNRLRDLEAARSASDAAEVIDQDAKVLRHQREAWSRVVTARQCVEREAEHLRGKRRDVVLGSAGGLPVTIPMESHIGVIGHTSITRPLVRSLRAQLRHAGASDLIETAVSLDALPRCDAVIRCEAVTRASLQHGPGEAVTFTPHYLSDRIAFDDELDHDAVATDTTVGMSVEVGSTRSGSGACIDLAAGPHAIIAGASGSGKTEFMRRWIVELVRRFGVDELELVLIDFKGGSGFDEFTVLPQVLAHVTDLDDSEALRVLRLVHSELARRERLFRRKGVRSFEQLATGDGHAECARLAVVIDEYQLLVERNQGVTELVADIAARGRSLGVHLVISTQHPSRAVRDHIAANCGLRISGRLHDAAESQHLLGSVAATALSGAGVMLVRDGDQVREMVFRAVSATEKDALIADRVRSKASVGVEVDGATRRFQSMPSGRSLAGMGEFESAMFGIDDIEHQEVRPFTLDKVSSMRVQGPSQSGRSTALARFAELARRSGATIIDCNGSIANRWQLLEQATKSSEIQCVIIDDFDDVIAQLDPEYRHEWLLRIRLLVTGDRHRVAISSRAPTPVDELFASSLLLGSGEGRGMWRSQAVQVVWQQAQSEPRHVTIPSVTFASTTVVVTEQPARCISFAAQAGVEAVPASSSQFTHLRDRLAASGRPLCLVATPMQWMRVGDQFVEEFGEVDMLFPDGRLSDLRSISRPHILPPLLEPTEAWLVRPGEAPTRVRWKLNSAQNLDVRPAVA